LVFSVTRFGFGSWLAPSFDQYRFGSGVFGFWFRSLGLVLVSVFGFGSGVNGTHSQHKNPQKAAHARPKKMTRQNQKPAVKKNQKRPEIFEDRGGKITKKMTSKN
jgi:hypothetical protein